MATLSAIYVTLASGVGFFAVTLGFFSIAVVQRSIFVAGRCVARPRDVIYNPNPKHPCQDRGSTIFGWMAWAMSLTFDTMLSGVPGTGTRDGGLKGKLLKVNLDGIVLLRFHHLGLRICFLATVLYLGVLLPIYFTAQYSEVRRDSSENCREYNLTDYQKLTLANIPTLNPDDSSSLLRHIDIQEREYLGRLYGVVLCAWIVTWYALSQLQMEWIDVLAMRRVYYLEANHYEDRKEELETIAEDAGTEDEAYIAKRAVWVPHPELRDTVPNIELYSVLVGGLPSLPTEAIENVDAVFSRKQSMDWQLSVTTAFFDHCVPNQPGFSSSVAAVTILPAAAQLTDAWKQWYKAAAKLRRLRFIRRRIGALRGKDTSSTELDVELGPSHHMKERRMSLHDDQVLGCETDVEVENHLFHALDFGPEQTAVYGREFAQGAASFAPNGWFEWRIKNANLAELQVLEKAAAEAVNEANIELQQARDRIADNSDSSSSMDEVSLDSKDATVAEVGLGGRPRNNSGHGFCGSGGGSRNNSDHGSHTSFSSNLTRGSTPSSSLNNRKRRLATKPSSGRQTSTTDTNSDSTDTKALDSVENDDGSEHSFGNYEAYESYSVELKDDTARHADARSVASAGLRKNSFLGKMKPGTKRLSKASLESTELPAGLGLEAGLWREQRKLSTGASQHIPRAKKSKSRMGNGIRGRKSIGDGKMPRSNSIDGATMGSRFSNDGDAMNERHSNHSMPNDHAVEVMPSRSSEKPHLCRSQSSDVILLSEPSWTTLEGQDSGIGVDGMQQLEPGLEDSIWQTLEKDKRRKDELRARLYRFRGLDGRSTSEGDDPLEGEVSEDPCAKNKSLEEKGSDSPSILSSLPPFTALWTASDYPNHEREVGTSKASEETADQPKPDPSAEPSETFESTDESSGQTARSSMQGTKRESHRSFREMIDAMNDDEEVGENLEIAYTFEQRAGLRKREHAFSRRGDTKTEKWHKVMSIVQETSKDMNVSEDVKERMIASGRWKIPSVEEISKALKRRLFNCFYRVKFRLKPPEILDDFARDSTYAVVTFTSRQAAVAARHCLADSRGSDRWVNLSDLPTPPLADAPSGTSISGFVRPVTLSISDTQKKIRHFAALLALATIYFFYTRPLTAAQNLVSADKLSELYPEIKEAQRKNPLMANALLGFIPALIWILFFAICPPMFKMIANFGSNATSSVKAENSALNYFWWFMVVSAFTGTSFETAIVDGFDGGVRIGSELQELLEKTATSIPLLVSANWLNWMIARMFIVLPTQYLLQMNTYLFTCLGLKCCQRAVRGGGAGPAIPYRIYVDSGVVMLCLFALAPASPLIAPAAFVYFLLCTPLLRWTMIFLYRPKFDIGGARFPFIFDICISGIIVGQILLTTMMGMKKATGPAIGAVLPLLPTIFYRYKMRRKYLRSFEDAALLQTSLLDGWDVDDELLDDEREDFRKFLVDCHKAAYVPVCIASGDARTLITAEPAVVIPLDFDVGNPQGDEVGSIQPDEKAHVQQAEATLSQQVKLAHQAGKEIGSSSVASRIPAVAPATPSTGSPAPPSPISSSKQEGRVMRVGTPARIPTPKADSPHRAALESAKPAIVPVLASSSNQPGRMMRRASIASRMQKFTVLSPVPSPRVSRKDTVGASFRRNKG